MSVDKLVDSTLLDAACTYEAGKIREKLGSSAQITYDLANGKGFGDAIAAIPSGGGGLTTISRGTFFGSNNSVAAGRQPVPIGKKMAKTDFWVRIWAKQGEEYERNGNYKWLTLTAVCFKEFGSYDLSTDNTANNFTESSTYTVDSNNAGTITQKKPGRIVLTGTYLNNDNIGTNYFNTFSIWRSRWNDGVYYDGFTIFLGHSNTLYPFPSTIEYNYEVVYFGNDPTNDIIDLS